jgi:hypothetical protein
LREIRQLARLLRSRAKGSLKNELASLAHRHFGPFTRKTLPGSWAGSDHALGAGRRRPPNSFWARTPTRCSIRRFRYWCWCFHRFGDRCGLFCTNGRRQSGECCLCDDSPHCLLTEVSGETGWHYG